MLRFDLNQNPFGDSVRMSLKRTMVQHELIFKDQVQELHRLYWTQKNLMHELYCKEQEAKLGSEKEGNVGSLEEAEVIYIDASGKGHRGFNQNSAKIPIVNEVIRPGYDGAKVAIDDKRGGVMDKRKNLDCCEVIELEGPVDNGFKIPRAKCGVMGSSQSDNVSDMASSSRIQNETGFVLDLNIMPPECSEQWGEHKADDHSGTGGSESSVAGGVDVSTSSSHAQEPNSFKPMLVDLNIPQEDEFSHAVNDPMITFSSPSPSSSVVQNEAFWIDQCNNRNFKETSPALNSEDKLANNVTNEDGLDENLLMERESDCLSGNIACTSSEKIMEENYETTRLDNNSLVDEQVCRHDEEDHAVIDAADILAGISSTQPLSQLEELFNNEKDQLEYSTDSFESMTLELPEVKSHEQHLVMPTRQTGTETEAEEEIAASKVNNKLRRGRGRAVRDFQKDVLPGIVSLSRLEICEDMHSIGCELRKNGSRRGNCFVPVNSGRLRRCSIHRKQ